MAKLTKKQKSQADQVDREKLYGVDEAISLAKTLATAKFDESIEVALNLGVDPRHADQMVRGVVNLPKGTGKSVRVAVFAKGAKTPRRFDSSRLVRSLVAARTSIQSAVTMNRDQLATQTTGGLS